jgi:uncharacterized protein YbcI
MSLNHPSESAPRDTPPVAPGTSRADSDGDVTVAISEQIVRLYLEAFGRGPTQVRTYVQPQFAVCVLRDILTTAERSLIESGGSAEVEAARARINETLDRRHVSIIETQTGRPVLSHLARIRPAEDIAVHFFLFDDVSVPADVRRP